jgi:hypothetical protein
MEHRWGIRRSLNVGVKLYVRGSPPRFGRLLDASASGGYVATNPPLPIMTRVHVALGWDRFHRGGRLRIAAYIVRADAHGIGIEWREFAPIAVLALMDPPQPHRSCISPMGISAITEASKDHAYIPPGRFMGISSSVHHE